MSIGCSRQGSEGGRPLQVIKQYIQQNLMQTLDPHSLALIKYQPDQILFLHKPTRITYRYLSSTTSSTRMTVSHPNILTGLPFDQGFLYQKEQSTLHSEISQRTRLHLKKQFSEEQVVNTFLPLFEAVEHLHQMGHLHGSIHLQNILIIDDQIKIRDGQALHQAASEYYQQQKELKDDVQALGNCMINCLLLTTTKPDPIEMENLLIQMLDKYSKHFILTVMIFARRMKEYFQLVPKLLQDTSLSIDEQLNENYEKLKIEREKKKRYAFAEEHPGQTYYATLKKMVFNNKKIIHCENIENKAELEGKKSTQRLVKHFDKITLSHDVMNKKTNEEEKKASEESLKRTSKVPVLNLCNFGAENHLKRMQRDRFSPFHRPKNYSKNK